MHEYKLQWESANVTTLLEKIDRCQLPDPITTTGWQWGCDRQFLLDLKQYWLHRFDWRAAMDRLNQYPQFTTCIDGQDIHFVHVVGEANGRRPLLLIHGWPGSHFEFWSMIEPLAYPSRFGGNAEDAFDLVIPSLPGFGFSGKPREPIGQKQTAAIFNTLMTQVLKYSQYLVQGGDFGSIVASWLGRNHSQSVRSIHLNMLPFRNDTPPQNEEEAAWMQQVTAHYQQFSAYSMLHMTKPLSLIWASADNPLGQAAWIIERFHDWSDLSDKAFTDIYSFDKLITNLMIYLMSDSFSSSIFYYIGLVNDGFSRLPAGQRVEVPIAYAAFDKDAVLPCPPRSRAELTYNICRWSTPPGGGHFAAMEQPEWLLEDIRQWAAELP